MARNDASSVRPGIKKKHRGGPAVPGKLGQRNVCKDERDPHYDRRLSVQRSIGHVGQLVFDREINNADETIEPLTRNPVYGDFAEPELVELAIVTGGISANAHTCRAGNGRPIWLTAA